MAHTERLRLPVGLWVWGLVALAFLACRDCRAQQTESLGCCKFSTWLTRGSVPFENHPAAHSLGGVGMMLVARGPWFSESFKNKRWKRLGIVAFGGAAWQFQNLKEIDGYSWKFAAYDLATNLLAATLFDLAFPPKRKR